MAVPKGKVSKARKGSRMSHNFRAKKVNLSECPTCHSPILSHVVCKTCGNYNGSKRIETKTDEVK